MNTSFVNNIARILKSRITRNVIFWLFTLWVVLNSNNQKDFAPIYFLFLSITTSLMLALTYINNLLIVPKLLQKRKYIIYTGAFLLHVSLISLSYVLVLKWGLNYIPVEHIQDVSFISGNISDKWTFDVIISEMSTYFFGFIMWLVIFTMAWYTRDYENKEKEIEIVKQKQTELELNFLKSQLNPHFLFNTLNNLYALALKQSEHTPESILKLSSLLRYLLYDTKTAYNDFEKEKELMLAYIDLELLRIEDPSDLHFNIETDKPCSIPPLLWLPVIENAFKYGTRYIADRYFISFEFTISQNILTIISKNKYNPTTAVSSENVSGGIGLMNLQKRLTLLYPEKHVVKINNEAEYFTIDIKIQLN
ncbi:MAG: histidine kinase [Saprospiraceae bacterium]|nr:histidine kinase [Candidatus Brachybacter algidus]